MRFVRYGVTLERLEHEHLETVRQWRNSSWVRPYMRYRCFIEPEQQRRWFDGLDPRCNWYFVAHADHAPFALFHVKGIDWKLKCGESGGFVGVPGFIGRPEPAQATLALMDFVFLVLHLDSLEAQYSIQLDRVVRFNERLGYSVFREDSDGFVRARVTSERYLTCAAPLRKAAATLYGTVAALADPDPWLTPLIERCGAPARPDFQLEIG